MTRPGPASFVVHIDESLKAARDVTNKSVFPIKDDLEYFLQLLNTLSYSNKELNEKIEALEKERPSYRVTPEIGQEIAEIDKYIKEKEKSLVILMSQSLVEEANKLLASNASLVQSLQVERERRRSDPIGLSGMTSDSARLRNKAEEMKEDIVYLSASSHKTSETHAKIENRKSTLANMELTIQELENVDNRKIGFMQELSTPTLSNFMVSLQVNQEKILNLGKARLALMAPIIADIREAKAKKADLLVERDIYERSYHSRVTKPIIKLIVEIHALFRSVKLRLLNILQHNKHAVSASDKKKFTMLEEKMQRSNADIAKMMGELWCSPVDDNLAADNTPRVDAKTVDMSLAPEEKAELSLEKITAVLNSKKDLTVAPVKGGTGSARISKLPPKVLQDKKRASTVIEQMKGHLTFPELTKEEARPVYLAIKLLGEMVGLLKKNQINTERLEEAFKSLTSEMLKEESERPILKYDESLANNRSIHEENMQAQDRYYAECLNRYAEKLNDCATLRRDLESKKTDIKKTSALEVLLAKPDYQELLQLVKNELKAEKEHDARSSRCSRGFGLFNCGSKATRRRESRIKELEKKYLELQSENVKVIKDHLLNFVQKKLDEAKIQEKTNLVPPTFACEHDEDFVHAHALLKESLHKQCYGFTQKCMFKLVEVVILIEDICNEIEDKTLAATVAKDLQMIERKLHRFHYMENGLRLVPFNYYLDEVRKTDEKVAAASFSYHG